MTGVSYFICTFNIQDTFCPFFFSLFPRKQMPWYSREQLLYGGCCLSEALFFCGWKALKGKELEFS